MGWSMQFTSVNRCITGPELWSPVVMQRFGLFVACSDANDGKCSDANDLALGLFYVGTSYKKNKNK